MACAEVSKIVATYKSHAVTETVGLQTMLTLPCSTFKLLFALGALVFWVWARMPRFSFCVIFMMIILV